MSRLGTEHFCINLPSIMEFSNCNIDCNTKLQSYTINESRGEVPFFKKALKVKYFKFPFSLYISVQQLMVSHIFQETFELCSVSGSSSSAMPRAWSV